MAPKWQILGNVVLCHLIDPLEVKKTKLTIFRHFFGKTIFFHTNLNYFSKLNLRTENRLITFFLLPMGQLEDKEPLYAHFRKFDPFRVKWGRGPYPPHSRVNRKKAHSR